MRAARYLVTSQQTAAALTATNLHLLLVRCLDLDQDTRERTQAVKLARKLLLYGPSSFPASLVRCLLALVSRQGRSSRDELWRAALAVLCELSCLNTELFLQCSGVRVLTAALLECGDTPRVGEAVLGCLTR